MAAITYAFYTNTYLGEPIGEADFPRALARAQRAVNLVTRGRAADPALPAHLAAAVTDAICAQIEYYALNGVDVSIGGMTADGWTVGKVSVSGGSGGKAATGAASMICPAAIATLEQTGILNPQVETLGEPPKVWWGW